MFRVRAIHRRVGRTMRALHLSGSDVRKMFLEYFTDRGHVAVRSSSVVPLCDPTVPFINAGMNQFKGIFLGRHTAPHPCVVNSQKCVRVGGKHNDLGVVGADGTHHTFFEMLGNWSFGDYYKNEACRLAWELLTGPYRLRPEELLVTYFGGDKILGIDEDTQTRDIWKHIGVQKSAIKPQGIADNFWEMGLTGPCGPCTEIHHVTPDGRLTEIWNLVFIQYSRESDGSIRQLPKHHVDTGMGLERATALLQGVRSNYDTDLFLPIIRAIETESRHGGRYTGKFGRDAALDCAYRCLADHGRMVTVCLADGMIPGTSLNLKQIMRKSFKISEDIFQVNSGLLCNLYDRVADILGPTYPEIINKMTDAKTIIQYEENSYAKFRSSLAKKWKELVEMYPEIDNLADVELSGFVEGYKQFKQAMSAVTSDTVPAEVVFMMYDTHGFSEDVIERVAQLNNYAVDRDGFQQHLHKHRSKHKSAFKERAENNKMIMFDKAIEKLRDSGTTATNDEHKYSYYEKENTVVFPKLNTNIVAILRSSGEWTESAEMNNKEIFYIVTKDTNFYCEDGGQAEDRGKIIINDLCFDVSSVFKARDIVFHKIAHPNEGYVRIGDSVKLQLDSARRLHCMRNHTATHLLNAAVRQVLRHSVVCQTGSSVTESGLALNLAVYGQKLSQDVMLQAQELVRSAIRSDSPVETSITDSVGLTNQDGVVTIPGETYPDTDLRLVHIQSEVLSSRELCCGTHVPSTRHIGEFVVTLVKGAGGHAPTVRALTGDAAKEVCELTDRARRLLGSASSHEARELEAQAEGVRGRLRAVCGTEGAAHGQHAICFELLTQLQNSIKELDKVSLNSLAETEMYEQALAAEASGHAFVVHFLMCSYLAESMSLAAALAPCRRLPAMVFGCADGIIKVACTVPQSCETEDFNAEKWLSCILPIFNAEIMPPPNTDRIEQFAAMYGTKVSLINCEGLVRDAMRIATAFAHAHVNGRHDDSMLHDNDKQLGRRLS